jgi:hypothetical protein
MLFRDESLTAYTPQYIIAFVKVRAIGESVMSAQELSSLSWKLISPAAYQI